MFACVGEGVEEAFGYLLLCLLSLATGGRILAKHRCLSSALSLAKHTEKEDVHLSSPLSLSRARTTKHCGDLSLSDLSLFSLSLSGPTTDGCAALDQEL